MENPTERKLESDMPSIDTQAHMSEPISKSHEEAFESPAEPNSATVRRLLLIFSLVILTAAVLILLLRDKGVPNSDARPMPNAVNELPMLDEDQRVLALWALDVGQGDCLFLRSPNGKTMLVDAGPAGSFSIIRHFLDQQNVTRLDAVVCTHLHTDHIGSMAELFDRYEVGALYLPPFDIESSTYAHMLAAMEDHGIVAQIVTASIEELPTWDSACQVYALAPYEVHYDDENDTSIILRVSYGNTAALLMGDATELSERLALKALPNHLFNANVLKVGHHGSDTSTCTKLLNAVKPQFAIISVGAFNDYGLPDEAVLNRLKKAGTRVLRTDIDSTVLIALDGTRAWVVE